MAEHDAGEAIVRIRADASGVAEEAQRAADGIADSLAGAGVAARKYREMEEAARKAREEEVKHANDTLVATAYKGAVRFGFYIFTGAYNEPTPHILI